MTSGVRWLSVGPGSGYGDAGLAYRAGLRAAGIPVSWTPLGWPSPTWNAPHGPVEAGDTRGFAQDIAGEAIEHDTVVVQSPPLWHSRLLEEAAGRALVAFTTWETDRLPPDRVDILNRYDRVIVPSRFNASVFKESGVRSPVSIVPHIVKPALASRRRRRKSGRFLFYLIATWTTRKAIPDAVSAFVLAFTAHDQVELVIHTTPEDHTACARSQRSGTPHAPAEAETWFTLARVLAGRRSVPLVRLSTRVLDPKELDDLHAESDCFLLLSHGEGWGLGAFDAAAFGNPVVVTRWGGTLDFLPNGYPYCVDCDLVPTITAEPDAWWAPRLGERWADARIDHAAQLLRRVFECREEGKEWGAALRSHVHELFNQARVTSALIAALDGADRANATITGLAGDSEPRP